MWLCLARSGIVFQGLHPTDSSISYLRFPCDGSSGGAGAVFAFRILFILTRVTCFSKSKRHPTLSQATAISSSRGWPVEISNCGHFPGPPGRHQYCGAGGGWPLSASSTFSLWHILFVVHSGTGFDTRTTGSGSSTRSPLGFFAKSQQTHGYQHLFMAFSVV